MAIFAAGRLDCVMNQPLGTGLESNVTVVELRRAYGGLRRYWMLWTIFVILLVLWLVGLVSSYTLGGFIHLLLLAAVVVLILLLLSGRRPVV